MAYLDVLMDALIDTAKMLPILLVVYFLIEFIEYKYAIKLQNNRVLKGKASPVFGALFGCVPQCGFSVVSTDLFTRGSLSIGALIAVYIATSDEAIPLMLSHPKEIPWLLLMIFVKIGVAIGVGVLANVVYKKYFAKGISAEKIQNEKIIHDHTDDEHEEEPSLVEHGGCCHHHLETKKYNWVHPLLHSLKIALFILIIRIIFGFVTDIWIGEERLASFLSTSLYFQPLFAILIGLIPNCASSVVLTELFMMRGLSFGGLLAGLIVNAGLGIIVLIKQHKNWKDNLFILSVLIITALIVGYALIWVRV